MNDSFPQNVSADKLLDQCHNLSEIRCSESAKNLGVVFDKFMTMEKFVNAKCQSAMYSLRCISKIRKCLDIEHMNYYNPQNVYVIKLLD